MAEPASSIITIVTVSLAVLKETYTFIKEIRLVNDLIRSLLTEIKDLHRLIKLVESTYIRVGIGENRHAADFVGRTLKTCQERLTPLKELVFELAAQESETWLQKTVLKGKSDGVKKQIEQAMRDMDRDMRRIEMGLSCWTIELANSHPDSAGTESPAAQHVRSASLFIEKSYDAAAHVRERSLSDADALYRSDSACETPLATRLSGSSTSSKSFDTDSAYSGSIISEHNAESSHATCDWKSFHTALMRENLPRIRTLLEQERELATIVNDCQRTPLHIAAQLGDVELARLLLEFGADKNACDSRPSTVLDLAVEYNRRDFVAFLIDQGVDGDTLSEQNKKRYHEMKRGIRLKKELGDPIPKQQRKESRSLSWVIRRGLSI